MEGNSNLIQIPFRLGNELTQQSFKLRQNDNTYMLAGDRYYQFYASYIRPRTGMYRGWIEGFHNTEYGKIPSLFLQKLGTGIKSILFGKPLVLNSNEVDTNSVTENQFKKSNFSNALNDAYDYSLDGGTGLLKWNKDDKGQLRAEAVPMDKFFITVDSYGDIEKVKSYIATYHDTIGGKEEYYLCEERFFKYTNIGGVRKRFPCVHYLFYKTSPDIVNENVPEPTPAIIWRDIPYDIRQIIRRDYGDIMIDSQEGVAEDGSKSWKFLPFEDDLGCRLIKFTRGIPAFPKLPFGQPIADLLMNESYAYDQLKFFERLEVYIARGRIMLDKAYDNPNDPDGKKSALDPLIFTYYDSIVGESDDKKPQGLQLELRAEAIAKQKQNILNDTAFALNLSSTSIASWLSDGQTQKTATEIEYERTKTTAFINDKIDIIHQPLQEMIDIFYHYYGVPSPELNIMPETQTVRSESIKLMSELYDKGQITAKMLAKEILGTCSTKEIEELADFITANKQQQPQQPTGGIV